MAITGDCNASLTITPWNIIPQKKGNYLENVHLTCVRPFNPEDYFISSMECARSFSVVSALARSVDQLNQIDHNLDKLLNFPIVSTNNTAAALSHI